MVKIQYASDLHLEFMENTLYLEAHPLHHVADILVLVGDTGYLGDEGFVKHPFWDWASENFKEVIVIPGNHEFYLGYDLGQLHDGWCMEIRLYRYCPWMRGMATSQISCNNGIDKKASHVPL